METEFDLSKLNYDNIDWDARLNDNVLNNFVCPGCGAQEDFEIWATRSGHAKVSNDGVIDFDGEDTLWEEDNACVCLECGCEGVVRNFQPLDDVDVDQLDVDDDGYAFFEYHINDWYEHDYVIEWNLQENGWVAFFVTEGHRYYHELYETGLVTYPREEELEEVALRLCIFIAEEEEKFKHEQARLELQASEAKREQEKLNATLEQPEIETDALPE